MRSMLPRRLLPWLFALSLLFGQAAAFAHSFTHAHDPALPDHVCEVCVAQASLGSAAPAAVFSLPIAAGAYLEPAPPAELAVTSRPTCALARAPPTAI
jgi:hypothetical protein